MKESLLRREVLPFMLALSVLCLAALLSDGLLHVINAVWIGRYLGIVGTLLILGSFGYSLRKRKLITHGQPARLLRWHERLAWTGALLVLVHSGIHFNAALAWIAALAMIVNVTSGLVGKFLLDRSRRRLTGLRQELQQQGASAVDIEGRLYWDSIAFEAIKNWRAVHFPITLAFVVLALAHIVSIFLFWSWK